MVCRVWIGGSLALGSLTSSKVALFRRRCARYVSLILLFGGLNGCIRSWVWRVGGSNLQFTVPHDGTAYLWTPPRAAGGAMLNGFAASWCISLWLCWWLSLLEAVGLYPLFQGLSRLSLWELAATESLVPSHFSFGSSSLRYLRFIS